VKLDPFIEAEEADGHSVKHCCEMFEVSRAAYYQRRTALPSAREVSDAELSDKIKAIHADSDGTYGSPRVHQELRRRGIHAGKRRVARLMRLAGLEGRCKRRWRRTTIQDPAASAEDLDLIQRVFGPGVTLDTRYCGDITYVPTWEGWAYLATVIDLASRRVVGWALADHMRTELVSEALVSAFGARRPEVGTIFHSDRGCQGGFKWPSQHLDHGGVGWRRCGSASGRSSCIGVRSRLLGRRRWRGGRTGCGSGRRSLAGRQPKMPQWRPGRHPPSRIGGSVTLAA
jgi:hypothetical protein